MGVGVGWTQGSMHGVGVGLEVKVFEDLTHNVRGLCPRLSIQVSSVYCSKIDLSF